MYFDSHCHLDKLDYSQLGSLDSILKEAREAGLVGFVCVAVDPGNWSQVIHLCESNSDVYGSVGIHPLANESLQLEGDAFLLAAQHQQIVAIGETGLDYFYSAHSRQRQIELFETHIELATQLQKPLIVHSREAKQDTLDILSAHASSGIQGVLHCFTEDWEMAEQVLDWGWYISFSGIITFNHAEVLREVVRRVPLSQLLVETDSPYLTPVPYRGQANHPKHVIEVAKMVAQIKQQPLPTIATTTTENCRRLFQIAL
ncbi:MAG TPA: hypothetical protein DCZ03_15245 [Gammaproteobacteria bacterium]|nr:hypothetical protein [Gammaproteobacteria bacterium]